MVWSDDWEMVVGLEVHAQLISNSKLFSGSAVDPFAAPNECASIIDLAIPGTLPMLNEFCVEQSVRTGLALGANVNKYSVFDRKNYFYVDLPSGYQISQFYYPIVTGGSVEIEGRSVRVARAHLEQDAGKSVHDMSSEHTYLDFNRAGVPLLEIVTEPDLRSAQEAVQFLRELQLILRYIGVCTGNMEDGAMRCDANVSVNRRGADTLGTRCEIKNLNSMNSIARAVQYEAESQISILERGGKIEQCTKLFDVDSGETHFLRYKENAREYRYFNDPDLPPVVLSDKYISDIAASMPELPSDKRRRYAQDYCLNIYDIGVLTNDKVAAEYFDKMMSCGGEPKLAVNWMTTELFGRLNSLGLDLSSSPVDPDRLHDLLDMISKGVISNKIAKEVLDTMMTSNLSPTAIVEAKGLHQIVDSSIIENAIDVILSENPDKVAEYRQGKERLFGFFVGQAMRVLGGRASPEIVNVILVNKLKI